FESGPGRGNVVKKTVPYASLSLCLLFTVESFRSLRLHGQEPDFLVEIIVSLYYY
ncbi:MAG: hypothetical protein QG577_1407, partial [Thermodesulfobacteriota bacterium]|nr:hypothetical protein [Thermodesulfobacteriota bacterium]